MASTGKIYLVLLLLYCAQAPTTLFAQEEGSAGHCLSFRSKKAAVTIPYSDSFNSLEALTIEAWIFPEGYTNAFPRILDWAISFNQRVTLAIQSSTKVLASNVMGHEIRGKTPIEIHRWTHVALTFDGDEALVYINGKLDSSTEFKATVSVPNTPLILGESRDAAVRNFSGCIDEFRFWKRARTETEIAKSFNRSIRPGEDGLIAYWKFDDAEGTQLTDENGQNHGTLNSGVLRWLVSDAPVSSSEPVVLPGDCNGDGKLNISDAICRLSSLFLGKVSENHPCIHRESSVKLLDANGDRLADISDVIYELQYLFVGGPEHILGNQCIWIFGCNDACQST